jgi:phosphatidylglycerol lysyltransferase
MCGLGLAAVLAMVVGLRWPLTFALLLLMLPLWSARRRFYRNHSLLAASTEGAWIRNVLFVIAAAAWLGFVVHRNVQYDNDLWWQFAFESDAPRMLRGLLMSLLVLTVYGFMRLLWPAPARLVVATDAERARATAIIAGSSRADAHLALLPDKQLLFADNDVGFLMYQRSGPCLIAMGDPVGPPECQQRLAWQFRELADRAGLSTVFYQVSAEDLPIYLDMGLNLSKLGEEAIIPLADFSLEGPRRAALRQEYRRAAREGGKFSVLPPEQVRAVMPRLREISDQWLDARESVEKRFSLGYFDEEYLATCPCAVVTQGDEIVAFANLWTTQDRSELSIDLMRHVEDGARHVMDFLFIELMLWGKANGYREFNLGMTPLAGMSSHALAPLWHKVGGFAWRHGERFYHFEGLRRYKGKFSPEWRPRYLASHGGIRNARVMFHASRLISGGTLQLLFR